MKRVLLYLSCVVFVGALGVSWATHGTGVVRNDPARNISIPTRLTAPLQVKAAYNGADMFFLYRWPSDNAGILHDMLRYEDGKWVTEGKAVPGPAKDGLHEDRVAMLLDDGSVPLFSRYGGYINIGDGIATFTHEASGDAVKAHPYLGVKLGEAEVTKYLPQTRRSLGDWADIAPEEDLAKLRAAGYFLDLWHWRANRSNPIGYADDQNVSLTRAGDGGKGPYATNWDGDLKQPKVMFDAAIAGHKALNWDDVAAGRIGQDDAYALVEGQAVPFDPAAGWKNGDTLPRRILRTPAASRGDIAVQGQGRWSDGYWDVTLRRAMDTGNPTDDKILRDKGSYDVAFAIHRTATGGRWHYVSLPMTLGLDHAADIVAVKFDGLTPPWNQEWTDVKLFYPGQVSWPMLNSARHAGAENIAKGVPVRYRHTEEQLANYGVEVEFADEIRRQWLLTMIAGVILIAGFGVALNRLANSRKGA